jgi:hypothetical protein
MILTPDKYMRIRATALLKGFILGRQARVQRETAERKTQEELLTEHKKTYKETK